MLRIKLDIYELILRKLIGLLSKKGRKVNRFGVVIAIIGAAVSACEKKFPKEKSNYFSKLGHSIQVQLEKGNIDEHKIREFIRLYIQIKNETNINIFIPQKLEKGLYSLERYYEVYENETWRFTELKTENLAERITPNNLRLCQRIWLKNF